MIIEYGQLTYNMHSFTISRASNSLVTNSVQASSSDDEKSSLVDFSSGLPLTVIIDISAGDVVVANGKSDSELFVPFELLLPDFESSFDDCLLLKPVVE